MGKNQTTSGPREDNATASSFAPFGRDPRTGRGRVVSRDDRPTAEDIAKRKPKTYRAIARGYADGRVIEAGEVFTTRADKGAWMEEVEGKQSALERAVDDAQSPISDDPDLTTFSKAALEARALELGLTNAKGLSKEDLIQVIQAGHDEDRAR